MHVCMKPSGQTIDLLTGSLTDQTLVNLIGKLKMFAEICRDSENIILLEATTTRNVRYVAWIGEWCNIATTSMQPYYLSAINTFFELLHNIPPIAKDCMYTCTSRQHDAISCSNSAASRRRPSISHYRPTLHTRS